MPSGLSGWRGEGVVPCPFWFRREIGWGFPLFESGVWFGWVFGAVCSCLVSGAHFPTGFFAVAGFAEGLEVIEAMASALGDILDVVDFEVFGCPAFDALVAISTECGSAEVLWCAS